MVTSAKCDVICRHDENKTEVRNRCCNFLQRIKHSKIKYLSSMLPWIEKRNLPLLPADSYICWLCRKDLYKLKNDLQNLGLSKQSVRRALVQLTAKLYVILDRQLPNSCLRIQLSSRSYKEPSRSKHDESRVSISFLKRHNKTTHRDDITTIGPLKDTQDLAQQPDKMDDGTRLDADADKTSASERTLSEWKSSDSDITAKKTDYKKKGFDGGNKITSSTDGVIVQMRGSSGQQKCRDAPSKGKLTLRPGITKKCSIPANSSFSTATAPCREATPKVKVEDTNWSSSESFDTSAQKCVYQFSDKAACNNKLDLSDGATIPRSKSWLQTEASYVDSKSPTKQYANRHANSSSASAGNVVMGVKRKPPSNEDITLLKKVQRKTRTDTLADVTLPNSNVEISNDNERSLYDESTEDERVQNNDVKERRKNRRSYKRYRKSRRDTRALRVSQTNVGKAAQNLQDRLRCLFGEKISKSESEDEQALLRPRFVLEKSIDSYSTEATDSPEDDEMSTCTRDIRTSTNNLPSVAKDASPVKAKDEINPSATVNTENVIGKIDALMESSEEDKRELKKVTKIIKPDTQEDTTRIIKPDTQEEDTKVENVGMQEATRVVDVEKYISKKKMHVLLQSLRQSMSKKIKSVIKRVDQRDKQHSQIMELSRKTPNFKYDSNNDCFSVNKDAYIHEDSSSSPNLSNITKLISDVKGKESNGSCAIVNCTICLALMKDNTNTDPYVSANQSPISTDDVQSLADDTSNASTIIVDHDAPSPKENYDGDEMRIIDKISCVNVSADQLSANIDNDQSAANKDASSHTDDELELEIKVKSKSESTSEALLWKIPTSIKAACNTDKFKSDLRRVISNYFSDNPQASTDGSLREKNPQDDVRLEDNGRQQDDGARPASISKTEDSAESSAPACDMFHLEKSSPSQVNSANEAEKRDTPVGRVKVRSNLGVQWYPTTMDLTKPSTTMDTTTAVDSSSVAVTASSRVSESSAPPSARSATVSTIITCVSARQLAGSASLMATCNTDKFNSDLRCKISNCFSDNPQVSIDGSLQEKNPQDDVRSGDNGRRPDDGAQPASSSVQSSLVNVKRDIMLNIGMCIIICRVFYNDKNSDNQQERNRKLMQNTKKLYHSLIEFDDSSENMLYHEFIMFLNDIVYKLNCSVLKDCPTSSEEIWQYMRYYFTLKHTYIDDDVPRALPKASTTSTSVQKSVQSVQQKPVASQEIPHAIRPQVQGDVALRAWYPVHSGVKTGSNEQQFADNTSNAAYVRQQQQGTFNTRLQLFPSKTGNIRQVPTTVSVASPQRFSDNASNNLHMPQLSSTNINWQQLPGNTTNAKYIQQSDTMTLNLKRQQFSGNTNNILNMQQPGPAAENSEWQRSWNNTNNIPRTQQSNPLATANNVRPQFSANTSIIPSVIQSPGSMTTGIGGQRLPSKILHITPQLGPSTAHINQHLFLKDSLDTPYLSRPRQYVTKNATNLPPILPKIAPISGINQTSRGANVTMYNVRDSLRDTSNVSNQQPSSSGYYSSYTLQDLTIRSSSLPAKRNVCAPANAATDRCYRLLKSNDAATTSVVNAQQTNLSQQSRRKSDLVPPVTSQNTSLASVQPSMSNKTTLFSAPAADLNAPLNYMNAIVATRITPGPEITPVQDMQKMLQQMSSQAARYIGSTAHFPLQTGTPSATASQRFNSQSYVAAHNVGTSNRAMENASMTINTAQQSAICNQQTTFLRQNVCLTNAALSNPSCNVLSHTQQSTNTYVIKNLPDYIFMPVKAPAISSQPELTRQETPDSTVVCGENVPQKCATGVAPQAASLEPHVSKKSTTRTEDSSAKSNAQAAHAASNKHTSTGTSVSRENAPTFTSVSTIPELLDSSKNSFNKTWNKTQSAPTKRAPASSQSAEQTSVSTYGFDFDLDIFTGIQKIMLQEHLEKYFQLPFKTKWHALTKHQLISRKLERSKLRCFENSLKKYRDKIIGKTAERTQAVEIPSLVANQKQESSARRSDKLTRSEKLGNTIKRLSNNANTLTTDSTPTDSPTRSRDEEPQAVEASSPIACQKQKSSARRSDELTRSEKLGNTIQRLSNNVNASTTDSTLIDSPTRLRDEEPQAVEASSSVACQKQESSARRSDELTRSEKLGNTIQRLSNNVNASTTDSTSTDSPTKLRDEESLETSVPKHATTPPSGLVESLKCNEVTSTSCQKSLGTSQEPKNQEKPDTSREDSAKEAPNIAEKLAESQPQDSRAEQLLKQLSSSLVTSTQGFVDECGELPSLISKQEESDEKLFIREHEPSPRTVNDAIKYKSGKLENLSKDTMNVNLIGSYHSSSDLEMIDELLMSKTVQEIFKKIEISEDMLCEEERDRSKAQSIDTLMQCEETEEKTLIRSNIGVSNEQLECTSEPKHREELPVFLVDIKEEENYNIKEEENYDKEEEENYDIKEEENYDINMYEDITEDDILPDHVATDNFTETKDLESASTLNICNVYTIPSSIYDQMNNFEMVLIQENQPKLLDEENEELSNLNKNSEVTNKEYMPCLRCKRRSTVRCGNCLTAFYCSQRCSNLHWNSSHHKDCELFSCTT